MTIEQHAEAAADEIGGRYEMDEIWAAEIIAPHMQAAIDEATAASLDLLQKAMTESDAKDRTIERQALRIAELEGLGPLIEEYIAEVNRLFYLEDQSGEMLDLSLKITAILKGGGS